MNWRSGLLVTGVILALLVAFILIATPAFMGDP